MKVVHEFTFIDEHEREMKINIPGSQIEMVLTGYMSNPEYLEGNHDFTAPNLVKLFLKSGRIVNVLCWITGEKPRLGLVAPSIASRIVAGEHGYDFAVRNVTIS